MYTWKVKGKMYDIVGMLGDREKKTALLSVRVGPRLKEALERIAEWEDRSLSYVIARQLGEYVKKEFPALLRVKENQGKDKSREYGYVSELKKDE